MRCWNLCPASRVRVPALHTAAKLKEQKRKKAYHKTPSGIKADTKKVKKRRLKQQKEREKRRKGTAPATRPLHSSTRRV